MNLISEMSSSPSSSITVNGYSSNAASPAYSRSYTDENSNSIFFFTFFPNCFFPDQELPSKLLSDIGLTEPVLQVFFSNTRLELALLCIISERTASIVGNTYTPRNFSRRHSLRIPYNTQFLFSSSDTGVTI